MEEIVVYYLMSLFSNFRSGFEVVTFFGSVYFIALVLIALLLINRRRFLMYLKMYVALWISIFALKLSVGRIRPNGDLYSFPSGHTANAFALAMLLYLEDKRYWPMFILAAIIGLSRIVLGEHYLSDVLFGAFFGMLIALFSFKERATK